MFLGHGHGTSCYCRLGGGSGEKASEANWTRGLQERHQETFCLHTIRQTERASFEHETNISDRFQLSRAGR